MTWTDPVVVDNSNNVTLYVQTHTSGARFAPGTTHVTYIFKDGAANLATCSFDVTIATTGTDNINLHGTYTKVGSLR